MDDWQSKRLTGVELKALFDALFPNGFAGADVVAEVAPDGWHNSPLLACFHPSVERVFEERLQFHRNIEALSRGRRKRDGEVKPGEPRPEPTLEEVRRDYVDEPVEQEKEVTELVGQCLWDVFSDNHEVIAADGRIADIGSFRGASAFLDEYLSGSDARESWREGDCMRFYMGTIWTGGRADLSPVYVMIFSRLKSLGADWVYHFPEIGLVDLTPLRKQLEKPTEYSPSEAFEAEQREQERQAEIAKTRAEFGEMNVRARQEAMDRLPPATVRAYHRVFGREPGGWPPA